jgi:hypothetical protein
MLLRDQQTAPGESRLAVQQVDGMLLQLVPLDWFEDPQGRVIWDSAMMIKVPGHKLSRCCLSGDSHSFSSLLINTHTHTHRCADRTNLCLNVCCKMQRASRFLLDPNAGMVAVELSEDVCRFAHVIRDISQERTARILAHKSQAPLVASIHLQIASDSVGKS